MKNKAKNVVASLALAGGLSGVGMAAVSPAVLSGSTATAGQPWQDVYIEEDQEEFMSTPPDLRAPASRSVVGP